MNLRLVILSILILPVKLSAQYLNYVDTTLDRHEITMNYLKTSSGYISCGATYYNADAPSNFRNVEVKTYDNNFNVITSDRFGDTLTIYQPYTICRLGNFYFSGGIKTFDTVSRAFIIKIDTLGNIINEYEVLDIYSFSSVVCLVSNNSHLFLAGNYVENNTQSVTLIKLDSSISEIWRINLSTTGWDIALNLGLTANNGLVLSTATVANNDDAKTMIYKLDTSGSVLWNKIYGGNQYWHLLRCKELPDGTYFCFGGQETSITGLYDSWFVKLDASGDFITDTTISVGIYDDEADYGFLTDDGVFVTGINYVNGGYLGYLSKFNFDGKHLWTREYAHRYSGNYLTSHIDLQNGFHLFAGWVMFEDSTTTNDEWFLVVDEFGCDITNCSLGISEMQEDKDILIYPNPASSVFTIKTLSENVDNRVSIYNSLGEIVLITNFQGNQVNIDISNISDGIYVLNIISGMDVYSKEIIVRR